MAIGVEVARLYAKLGADVSEFERAMKKSDSALGKTGAALTTFAKVGVAGAVAGVGALGAGMAASLKSAISFESAFTGVIKTVDATDEQLAGLRKGILDMSNELPASASNIASVAEAAGQLGIRTENVLDFTRVMSDLGVTTNMSATDAATALARFANITGMSQDNFDRLGSSVVALGNNLATTESEIVTMGLRIAGAGAQVGLTEAQILGFAGSLSSVGIEAEAGGTAISRVMIDMASEVATGGEKLAGFAKVAGMSAGEFSKAFKQDAAGAIVAFIRGLDKMSRTGGNVFGALDELGFGEIRVRDALLRASGAVDLFDNALKLSASAWEENIALTKEAELRYGTVESKLQLFRNAIETVRIGIGDKLMPVFGDLLSWATDLVKKHGPSVIDWFGVVAEQIKAVASAFTGGDFAGLGSIFTDWAASLWKLTRPLMMGFWIQLVKWINNPVLRTKVLKAVQRAWDSFTAWARGLWNNIRPALGAMWKALTQWSADPLKANALTAYGLLLTQGLWKWAKGLWGIISKDLGSLWTELTSWVTDPTKRSQLWGWAVDLFKALWNWAADLWNGTEGQEGIAAKLGRMWGNLTSWVTDANKRQQLWNGIVSTWNSFTEWAGKVWEWVSPILDGAWTSLISWVTDPAKRQQLWNGIVNTWTAITEWAGALWDWVSPGLGTLWTNLTAWVTDPEKRSQLWTNVKNTWTGFTEWAGKIWEWASPKLSQFWTDLSSWVTNPTKRRDLLNAIANAWTSFADWVAGIWNGSEGQPGLGSKLATMWNTMTSWVTDPTKRAQLLASISSAWTSFSEWASAIWEGTPENPEGVKAKLEAFLVNINRWLDENRPNTKPWRDEMGEFVTGFGEEWERNLPKFETRWSNFVGHIKKELAALDLAFSSSFGSSGKTVGMFVADMAYVIGDLLFTVLESMITKARLVGSAFMALGRALIAMAQGDFDTAGAEMGKLGGFAREFVENYARYREWWERAGVTLGPSAPGGGGGGFGGDNTGGSGDSPAPQPPSFQGYEGVYAEHNGIFWQWKNGRWEQVTGRAAGGPVGRGTYLVGEQGPELVTMGGSGHVYNADETAAMLGSRHITVDLNVRGESNLPTDRAKLKELARALLGEMQLRGMRVAV